MLPTLFISHGAPTLPLEDVPARHFLSSLGQSLEHPKAILVATAHWETEVPTVNAVALNATIHDFYGFPRALYEMTYLAPGSPTLAHRAAALLTASGLGSAIDTDRGLDHGAWVPLKLMYPDADIPVVGLSVQSHLGPAHHYRVGRALAPLRGEGVLVIGSGSFTHDLSRFRGQRPDAPLEPDVVAFADWFVQAVADGRTDDLLAYRNRAPHAARNHPTEEHLLPLFVALGAAGADTAMKRVHTSGAYGILRMDAFEFGLAA